MITIFTGPMFSGKSNRLIDEYEKFYNKEDILVLKPVKDTRTTSKIRARGRNIDIQAISIKDLSDIYNIISSDKYKDNRVIFIDEAQFITGDVSVILDLSLYDFDFYIAGLNLTSEQKPFGIMPNLIAIADKVEFLKAKCSRCNKDASYTHCVVPKDKEILVGSNEYIPLCRDCLKGEISNEFSSKYYN